MPRVIHPQQVNLIKTKEKQDAETLKNRKVFHTTRYIIVQSDTGFSVYEITTIGENLIRTVSKALLLSDEEETLIIECPNLDPAQKIEVIKTTIKHLKKNTQSIIFKSKYKHIGIALFEPPNTTVGIIEITPPPFKLLDQAKNAQKQGLVRKDTKFKIKTIDILKEIPETNLPIVYPCSTSTERKFIYLDTDSEKIASLKEPVIVVGCPITFETVKELNPKIEIKKIDVCPVHYARKETTPNDFYIVRCCRASIQGTQTYSPKSKPIIALEWGPTQENFLDAIYLGTLIKKYPNYPQF
ncbi:MAG: hypothetical protein QW279_16230 [Candidatus Jordarchaeaceae archaeon]